MFSQAYTTNSNSNSDTTIVLNFVSSWIVPAWAHIFGSRARLFSDAQERSNKHGKLRSSLCLKQLFLKEECMVFFVTTVEMRKTKILKHTINLQ